MDGRREPNDLAGTEAIPAGGNETDIRTSLASSANRFHRSDTRDKRAIRPPETRSLVTGRPGLGRSITSVRRATESPNQAEAFTNAAWRTICPVRISATSRRQCGRLLLKAVERILGSNGAVWCLWFGKSPSSLVAEVCFFSCSNFLGAVVAPPKRPR